MNTKNVANFWKPMTTAFLLLALLLTPLSAFAAEMAPTNEVRAVELSGTLDSAGSRHYLSLVPSERDGEVKLTLTFGPQSNDRIANKVNFWVLSQEALQLTTDSTVKYYQVALASGSPISGKSDDYKVEATFKVTGKQQYTVIVHNDASVAANYSLTVKNGTLIDASGQTNPPASVAVSSATMSTNSDTTTSASMAENDSKKISGVNAGRGEQLYYTLVAVDNDEDVTITFDYDPKDNSELDGQINFFVFNEDGLGLLKSGVRPEFANLASGNLVKEGKTQRSVTFRAVGKQSFTVMVMNRSAVPATFTLAVSGGDFQ